MQRNIESIEYIKCGYCENDLKRVYKGIKSQKRKFYAGVFLIKHKAHGYILYDTGYNKDIMSMFFDSFIYRTINPTKFREEDSIEKKLLSRGISPKAIKHVIVSHLHPDHIGGLKEFTNAKFWITKSLFESIKNIKIRDLVFKRYLPDDFLERLKVFEPSRMNKKFPFAPTQKAFDDESLLLASFNGHAKGQLCVFFPEWKLFIASDLCWGIDLLLKNYKIKFLAGLIQSNKKEYLKNMDLLKEILKVNYVLVSHDRPKRVIKTLNRAFQYSMRDRNE